MEGDSFPEARKLFALAVVESVQEFGGGSSGGSGVVLCGRAVCDAGAVGDSARAETLAVRSWRVRAFKGPRRSGNDAVPRTSPGSSSWYPAKGIGFRPEETKRSEGSESWTGNKSTM